MLLLSSPPPTPYWWFLNGEILTPQEEELPTLQQELMDTKQALTIANQDKEKLLQEIRKYNPLFEL